MTLISSFRILISTPVMVSQECVLLLVLRAQGKRLSQKLGGKISDKYVFVYADDYFKDVCYAAAQKKYPLS
jgi:hypothetical protein